MKNIKINWQLLLYLLMFIPTGPVFAAPRVVVSIPSLHSLVSALMDGAAQPQLLFAEEINYSGKMGPFQKSRMITADIVIWVGPGLETPIVQALDQLPGLDIKMLTLSNYVPLMSHTDGEVSTLSRQMSRDLQFWSDPRLAIMAVRMITPRLVRLDPEHQELYLDNEITLINKLKILEQEITAKFTPYNIQWGDTVAGVGRYFSHRFITTTNSKPVGTGMSRKVSMDGSRTCVPETKSDNNITPSTSYYFESMRLIAESVYSCFEKSMDPTTASQQGIKKVVL